MWRKDEPNKTQPSSDSSSSPGPAPERPAASVSPGSPIASASGSHGIRIKGEISGRGDLFWDGVVQGKIHITDGSFTVGRNAHIDAEIEAREIIIHGEVKGALKGDRVQIFGTGKVTGDVETRGIVIEDGAMLRSKVQVRREDEPPAARAEASPRARQAAATSSGQTKDKSTEI